MNRNQAVAKLRPMLGKRLAWREDERALTGEAREAALAILEAANARKRELCEARDARRRAVLEADTEYQRLCQAASDAGSEASKMAGRAHRRRVTVGTTSSVGGIGFFHVAADGDNWQEAVDRVKASKLDRV